MAYSIAHKLVGCAFEHQLLCSFPKWKKIRDGANKPDFDAGDFYVEAKGSHIDNGSRPKWYQVCSFARLDKPVVYALGFHQLYGIQELELVLPTSFLIKSVNAQIQFNPLYFVSARIVHTMLEMECFTSKKKKEKYFCIKPRHLERIIDGEPFVRRGVSVNAQERYNLQRRDFILESAGGGAEPKKQGYGYLLDKSCDKVVIDYFNL